MLCIITSDVSSRGWLWELVLSSLFLQSHTTMARGTKSQTRAAPERYPGHNLSTTQVLHAVNMKLSQVDATMYARRAPLVDLPQIKLFF